MAGWDERPASGHRCSRCCLVDRGSRPNVLLPRIFERSIPMDLFWNAFFDEIEGIAKEAGALSMLGRAAVTAGRGIKRGAGGTRRALGWVRRKTTARPYAPTPPPEPKVKVTTVANGKAVEEPQKPQEPPPRGVIEDTKRLVGAVAPTVKQMAPWYAMDWLQQRRQRKAMEEQRRKAATGPYF